MCGRFTLKTPAAKVAELFDLDDIVPIEARYNIAPTQQVAIVRNAPNSDHRELSQVRWGLVPFWAKDLSMGARMINARAESITEKPAFRDAFKKRRCLVVADGFYEWKSQGKKKQPFYIHKHEDEPFAFAGLWERWTSKTDSQTIESCTIITTSANRTMESLHERMPVILPREGFADWLSGTSGEEVLVPYQGDDLTLTAVSTLVNNVRNDSPECLQPPSDSE